MRRRHQCSHRMSDQGLSLELRGAEELGLSLGAHSAWVSCELFLGR